MFIGGLVSPETEKISIAAAVSIGFVVLLFLGLDIIKQRRKRWLHMCLFATGYVSGKKLLELTIS